MGFVYYGVYASYFEVARVELLRSVGVNYKDLESGGLLMPVTHYDIRYIKPARYDELLQIHSVVVTMTSARIKFNYEIYIDEKKICDASTTLAFLNAQTLRPTRCPQHLVDLISPSFNS